MMYKSTLHVAVAVVCVLAGMSLLTVGSLIPFFLQQRGPDEIYLWLSVGIFSNPVGMILTYLGIRSIYQENTVIDQIVELWGAENPNYGFWVMFSAFLLINHVSHIRIVHVQTGTLDFVMVLGLAGFIAMLVHSIYKLVKAR